VNCTDWEERVSLYAGGDLAAAEALDVERHIAGCAACQLVLSGVREGLELLREAHDAEIAPAHLAAVRARVLAQLGRERVLWWRVWLFGLALGTAALIAALAVWPGRQPGTPETTMPAPPQLAVHHAPPPDVALVPPEAAMPADAAPLRRVRSVRRKPRKLAPRNSGPAEPLVVKLVTDNPDVVIYWIADKRGE
jgi:hypothetical protein